jgi:hypothetical protein
MLSLLSGDEQAISTKIWSPYIQIIALARVYLPVSR